MLEPVLSQALRAFPVVVLIGARQTGKTTLARHLGKDRRLYRTLDDLTVLDQAERAPDSLLREGEITLDEVQRALAVRLERPPTVAAGLQAPTVEATAAVAPFLLVPRRRRTARQ